jgi:hypothetical protein
MPNDWEQFNCSESWEHDYVVGLYAEMNHPRVRQFLNDKCGDGTIKNYSHTDVYDLIEKKLGLTRE